MKSTTKLFRDIPHSLRLESSARFNPISFYDSSSLSDLDSCTNMRNFPVLGVLQSNANANNDANTSETEGVTPLGTTISDAVDGEKTVSKPRFYEPLKRILARPNRDGQDHDIKNFMARPVVVKQGVLSATDNANTFIYGDVFDAMVLANMMTSKLRGAYLVRATTHITLQVNANRMQQGRYILAFMPHGGMGKTTTEFVNYYKMHRATKCEITQLRHINMDINCDTEIELVIPYVSIYPGWAFQGAGSVIGVGSPGVYFLYPYRPLSSTSGSTTASYQILIHYTDVEIEGVGVAQMGKKIISKGRGDFLKEEAVSPRPISTGFKQLSLAAASFAEIPLLSPFMGISSVVTDALSNFAYTLGWSKPVHSAIQNRIRKEPFPYLSVGDSHDIVDPLSITLNNSVGVIGGLSSTDQDELSIDFLKSIPAWIAGYDWTTASAVNSTIASIAVTTSLVFSTNDTKNTIYSWCPVAYLSRMFSFWRGSLKYTLKFTRTEFHSGRLLIRFIPFDDKAYANPGVTANNNPYMLRAIVDIRECNEFSFTVPFIYTTHWADTVDSIGNILVQVLDPLVAPATVSSTINIDLEVAGGPDLQFSGYGAAGIGYGQFPDQKALWATVPFILQSGLNKPLGVLQGNTAEGRDDCSFGEVNIGNAIIDAPSYELAAACHGEVYRSFRPLLKRGGLLNNVNFTASNNSLCITPRLISIGASATGVVNGDPQWDPLALLAPLYSIMRGNARVKTLTLTGGSGAITPDKLTALYTIGIGKFALIPNLATVAAIPLSSPNFVGRYATSAMGMNYTQEAGVSVQVPFFAHTPGICVGDNLYQTNTTNFPLSIDKVGVTIGFFNSDGSIPAVLPATYVHRSVGDDFNLSGFVSIPCSTIIPTP